MDKIDLQPFCGSDWSRPYLHKPFSRGDFTFATNAHILVRVPRREDVPEEPNPIKDPNTALAGIETASFAPPAPHSLPPAPEKGPCADCEGRGTDHVCPDCECTCETCDGSGEAEPKASTTVGSVHFDLKYVRQVLSLPNVEIAEPKDRAPLFFRFSGGVGGVMPLHGGPRKIHVEIFEKTDA